MILSFGALAPKISEQLVGRLSQKDAEAFDADAFELCRLQIRGLLSDGEANKARQRLVKMIEKALKKNRGKVDEKAG